ncbi:probable receptor-like protein kinase At1g80640 [Solanum stenotomum]|uniref:probable receptor-like protein kinase At1g80640 n=1 Tax=Solanum stenotomum TaxID=172797 RepID=UPI0020D08E52|nr:probable receptor-like protein kinase At1g80640 [Solanum stenotomum]
MKLKGFCFQNILAVVYDETPTQYLSRVISEESFRWEDRMKVATQLASLFTWLHEKRFAIGRMEPSAIMIDKEFNIKVVDFSSLVRVRDIPHNILPNAPEADNVTETLKDDVYAFGILLLRLITNNKNIEGPYHWWILEELQGGKRSIVDK